MGHIRLTSMHLITLLFSMLYHSSATYSLAGEQAPEVPAPRLPISKGMALLTRLEQLRVCGIRKRDEMLAVLSALRADTREEGQRYLIDGVITELLLKWKFVPGMTKADIKEAREGALRKAREKFEEVKKAYPQKATDAYLLFLHMKILYSSYSKEDQEKAGALARKILSDWKGTVKSVGEFPKNLKLMLLREARWPIHKQVKEQIQDNMSSSERSVLVETELLKMLKDLNAPREIVTYQEHELAARIAIVEGADPNKKLDSQIPLPEAPSPTDQAPSDSATLPSSSRGEEGVTTSALNVAVAALAFLVVAIAALVLTHVKRKRNN